MVCVWGGGGGGRGSIYVKFVFINLPKTCLLYNESLCYHMELILSLKSAYVKRDLWKQKTHRRSESTRLGFNESVYMCNQL